MTVERTSAERGDDMTSFPANLNVRIFDHSPSVAAAIFTRASAPYLSNMSSNSAREAAIQGLKSGCRSKTSWSSVKATHEGRVRHVRCKPAEGH